MRRWLTALGARWTKDDIPRLSAATSFYALLSLAPFLVVAVAIAAQVFGSQGSAKAELLRAFKQSTGPQVAEFLRTVIDNSSHTSTSVIATLVSLSIAVWSGSNLFIQIHESIHDIWAMHFEGHMIRRFVWARAWAVAALFGLGLLIVTWLVIESVLASMGRETWGYRVGKIVSLFAGLGFFTLAFAAIFRSMPRGQINWRDVWPGAFITALGLTFSKYILGTYLSVIKVSTAYGSAGVLVVLLLWIYYLSMIFFLGVEIVHMTVHREQLTGDPKDTPAPGALANNTAPAPTNEPTVPPL